MSRTASAARARPHVRTDLARWLQESVLKWAAQSGRSFPWRDTPNPFHVLIAVVLLRQTQAARVAGPYVDLITRYPDARSLASADVRRLRRWFRPLGLVRRADHLVQLAQTLVRDHGGEVPCDLETLLTLPGMGTYSARAVLCLGFRARVPMIDEGSGRVLRRVLGLEARGPAYSDRQLLEIVTRILPEESSKEFNLGLIDIAATYCHPVSPECPSCPLLHACALGTSRIRDGSRSAADGHGRDKTRPF